MRLLAGLAAVSSLVGALAEPPQVPAPISVYTFSRDSAGGFQDDRLDLFRRELGRYVEGFTELSYAGEDADVRILFLGPGQLSVAIGTDGRTERHLFTPDEEADRTWVVLHIESFAKEFSVEGSGGRDLARLAKSVSDWLAANSTSIRERYLGR